LKDVALLATEEIDAKELNTIHISDTISLRVGKYGPFLEVVDLNTGEQRRVNLPPELSPDELTADKAQELADAPPVEDRIVGVDPETGREIVAKNGRFGPYVSEVIPEEPEPGEGEKKKKKTAEKPKTASLFSSMSVDTIDLETALRLLALPREVGVDPESGEVITSQNGRYGPYLRKGTDSRSIDSEELIFDITLEQALARFAEPKYGGRRQAAAPLKTFGEDPVSGKTVTVKSGRFGPYVTDGETNATIPRGMDPAQIEEADAFTLLAEKRAKGPSTRAKKAPAKKSPAKKKAPAKKPAAKRTPASKKSEG
jgi:DNA topoisomerase I